MSYRTGSPASVGKITNNILRLHNLNPKLPEQRSETAPQPEFMHPILTPEDFKRTLSLYNRHIKQYNMEVWIEHKEIRRYNREVIRNRRQISVTREMKIAEYLWKEEHKDLDPAAYNEAAEKYNQEHGPQLRKRNLRQEVKPATEKYFLAFLYQYNAQLFQRKDLRAGLNVHVKGELPKFKLYPNKIIEAEKDECKILNVSVETVRHHRERLQEAGVLMDYSYHGPNRPVQIAFNSSILSITDNGMPKSTRNENQPLSGSQTKKVPHNNVSSSLQSLEESKSSEKGVAADASTNKDCTGTSTRTPRKQGGKKFDAPGPSTSSGPEKNDKKFGGAPSHFTDALNKNELSAVLTASLDPATDLAKDLADGKHDHHVPLHRQIAQQEAYYGAMHPTDFKELAIQDVFKFSASLFSRINAHPGSWMNAYKIWMAEEFKNFNKQQLNKPNLFARWMKMIEVLRQVKKYQAKHEGYNPTFPSLYFDTTRREKDHNSFFYAFSNFKLDEEESGSYQKRKVMANKSLRHKTELEKARTKIRQHFKDQCSLQEVYDYVYNVCSKEISGNINHLIKKEFEKYNA